MEGDVVTQNLFVYDITGEDAHGTHYRAASLDRYRAAALLGTRADTYGEEKRLAAALDAARSRRERVRRS